MRTAGVVAAIEVLRTEVQLAAERERLIIAENDAATSFTAASLMCGLAPSLGFMIVFRILQGLSGGVMQPLSQAILLEAFPPEERGKAMGFWGIGILAAPILGPVMGGWLTEIWSWRWVFYINLPVGLIAVVMVWLFIFAPPYIRRGTARIDYWGIGLLLSRVDGRKLLALGFLFGAITLYWLSRLNSDAGYWDLFWPQFFQGLAFGLLFVPLTTVTMDPILNAGMGNATSLFNLMRRPRSGSKGPGAIAE
jgi:MFS family permease